MSSSNKRLAKAHPQRAYKRTRCDRKDAQHLKRMTRTALVMRKKPRSTDRYNYEINLVAAIMPAFIDMPWITPRFREHTHMVAKAISFARGFKTFKITKSINKSRYIRYKIMTDDLENVIMFNFLYGKVTYLVYECV